MFRTGFRNCMQLFHSFSRKSLPQAGGSLFFEGNPDFTFVSRTVTFFNKGNFVSLLKSTTSVSPAGKRRGRGREKNRKIFSNPNKGQIIGSGEANIVWPGLNSPIFDNKDIQEMKIQSPDPQFEEKLLAGRSTILKKKIPKIHELERGWSGNSLCGRKFGPPEPVYGEEFQGFETVVLEYRVRHKMASVKGKFKTASAFLAVGNKKGALGVAIGTSSEPKLAIKRAQRKAASKLHCYKFEDVHTINHDFYYKFGKVKLFAYRRPQGYGLVCHRAIAEVCKLIGIKDLYAKVEGSTNTRYVVKAFLLGLIDQKSFQQIANESGYHLVEFKEEQMNFPRLLASPAQGAHKECNIVLFQEYIMGGLPLKRKVPENNSRNYELHFKKTHYRRNMDDVKIRMWAKHGKLTSHLADIYPECERIK